MGYSFPLSGKSYYPQVAANVPPGVTKFMNEAEWWSCENPHDMLEFLFMAASRTDENQHRVLMPPLSERKMRLFVEACARDLLVYRPASATADAWDDIEKFKAAIDRVEAYVDGKGSLEESWIWIECPDVSDSAFAVVGYDWDIGMQRRDPLEAITDFRVNPAHWLRDIFGPLLFRSVPPLDPHVLAWGNSTVPNLARGIYEERQLPEGTLDQQGLGILADALEEAGCTDTTILSHCRGPETHIRGCWVVDLLLGKS
jgi:hypothetical protein